MNETQEALAMITAQMCIKTAADIMHLGQTENETLLKTCTLVALVKQLIPKSLCTYELTQGIDYFCKMVTLHTKNDLLEKLSWVDNKPTDQQSVVA